VRRGSTRAAKKACGVLNDWVAEVLVDAAVLPELGVPL
jgi:hypothetical protein